MSAPADRAVTARVRALAKDLGATVTINRDRFDLEHEVTADAPDGCVWSGSAVHQLVCGGSEGEPLAGILADLLDRMCAGVERCEDPACEVCHPDACEVTP
jgi:hypothetical protein